MDRILHFATTGISLGIATASEAIAGHKNNKVAWSRQTVQNGVENSEHQPESDDDLIERAWELDDAGQEQNPPAYREEETAPASAEDVALSFITHHRNTINTPFEHKALPQPVILPQRRPKQRSRGFVRAYAPSLGECSGIDQNTFIDFLNDFEKASKASPIFDVINIACFGVGLVPSSICMAVSTTVGVANQAAQELQTRYRTNQYLDNINETMFKPRGLYVMVMAYSPDMAEEPILRADTSDPTSLSLVKTLTTNESTLKQKLTRFRYASGTVKTDIQMPQPAPLIYPALDQALLTDFTTTATTPPQSLTTTSTQTSLSKSRSKTPSQIIVTNSYIQDYLDRRAQADFIAKNPNSKLASTYAPQEKQFVNRFCDPDHPVNAGSIFGLLTGGTFDPIAMGRVSRAESRAKRNGDPPLTDAEKHDAYMGRKVRGKVTGTPSKTLPLVGKLFKKGVLYLVVVNLPSEEEVRRMRIELEGA